MDRYRRYLPRVIQRRSSASQASAALRAEKNKRYVEKDKSQDTVERRQDTMIKFQDRMDKFQDRMTKSQDTMEKFQNRMDKFQETMDKFQETMNKFQDRLDKSQDTIEKFQDTMSRDCRDIMSFSRDTMIDHRNKICKFQELISLCHHTMTFSQYTLDSFRDTTDKFLYKVKKSRDYNSRFESPAETRIPEASGTEPSSTDADDYERDVEIPTSSNGDKGKRPLRESPEFDKKLKSIYDSKPVGVLPLPIWDDHTSRLHEINESLPALMDWLLLRSESSNSSERQFSFLKLLTLYGLNQSFETLSYRPGSGPSEISNIRGGEYATEREQNKISFYNGLEIGKIQGILPSAARSLPAGVPLYMLLVELGIEMEGVDEELLREFLLLSGYTDDHGNMDMNAFCEWAWDFRVRETSDAYVAAEFLGNFDGGPAGEFFRILVDGHQSEYTLTTITAAFLALGAHIPTYEAILLLQDPWTFYQQIQAETTSRYIRYLPHPTTRAYVFDKWEPVHRLMIFVTCFMTLSVEDQTGKESPATPEREPSPESMMSQNDIELKGRALSIGCSPECMHHKRKHDGDGT